MTASSPFVTTATTTTRTTEEDRTKPIVVNKHTVATAGGSQVTKDTQQSATATTSTKNTNLAPNFVQPGGPFPPFVTTVSTPPSVATAPGSLAAAATALVGSSPVPAPASTASPGAVVINPGSSPVLSFVPTNPAQEVDVTTPSVTTTQETDTTQALSPTITDETDTTGESVATKVTSTVTTVVTSPAMTNQYEHAGWILPRTGRSTILSFLPAGISALYLAIYRVTNDNDSGPVQVLTDAGQIDLAAGNSVDISSQTITVVGSPGSHGSYQNLCCAAQPLKVDTPPAPPPAPPPPPDGIPVNVDIGDPPDGPDGVPVNVGTGDGEPPPPKAEEDGVPVNVSAGDS